MTKVQFAVSDIVEVSQNITSTNGRNRIHKLRRLHVARKILTRLYIAYNSVHLQCHEES